MEARASVTAGEATGEAVPGRPASDEAAALARAGAKASGEVEGEAGLAQGEAGVRVPGEGETSRGLGTEEGVTRRPVGKVTNIRRPGGKWQTSWRQVADILEVTRLLP